MIVLPGTCTIQQSSLVHHNARVDSGWGWLGQQGTTVQGLPAG